MARLGVSGSLMQAAMAGDREATLALMSVCDSDIRRYARRSCHRPSDVDDAVQETLWVLYRRIAGLRQAAAFSSWLFAVVERACFRLARMGRSDIDITTMSDDLSLSSRPEAELRLDLASGIQSLPQHYRDVLLFRDVEEMTIDEIASLLTLTRETVKARLHRARVLMREYLSI